MHAHEHDTTTNAAKRVGMGREELDVRRAIDMCAR
jgi:hypothetical protein